MNWLNTKYMIRAGVLTMLLLFPSLLSATCKPDTIIRNYKPDSLKLAIKADSIIAPVAAHAGGDLTPHLLPRLPPVAH